MFIFSLNGNHPLNSLDLASQELLIGLAINSFCERPLLGNSMLGSELRIYDGILGDAIRALNAYSALDIPMEPELKEFTDAWAFRGDIYRIMRVPSRASFWSKLTMHWIDWHGMVASWSKSHDFTTGYNKVNPNLKYCFLHASTGDDFGIDVNKLRSRLGIENPYTCQENEIIFPMARNYVIDIYHSMTPREFLEHMQSKK